MGQNINTAQQVMKNIEYEVETLNRHIQLTHDDTVLFMLGGVKAGGSKTKITSVLLGEYERNVALLGCLMSENEEIRSFIFDSFKSYLTQNGNTHTAMIKVPVNSGLGQKLKEMFSRFDNKKTNDNDNE